MEAGLIAPVADVDLQRFQLAAAQSGEMNFFEQRQCIAHR
jgi:hypothetical protein